MSETPTPRTDDLITGQGQEMFYGGTEENYESIGRDHKHQMEQHALELERENTKLHQAVETLQAIVDQGGRIGYGSAVTSAIEKLQVERDQLRKQLADEERHFKKMDAERRAFIEELESELVTLRLQLDVMTKNQDMLQTKT